MRNNHPWFIRFVIGIAIGASLFVGPVFAKEEQPEPEKACQRAEDCVIAGPKCDAINKNYAKPEDIKRCEDTQIGKPFGADFTGCIHSQCALGVHF